MTKVANGIKRGHGRSYLHRRRWVGLYYIMPWIIGFFIFQLYPFIASLTYSLTSFSFGQAPEFLGFGNYVRLFTRDAQFLRTLSITAQYALIAVPGKLVCALLVALLLNTSMRGIGLYRTVYYMPSILGGSVAVSVLWRVIFMRDGIVNRMIGLLGIQSVDWLTNPSIALFTISMLQIWQFGSAMVIFLAALKQIPYELYEAAEVDGASNLRRFFSITLPQISSVVLFNLIMQSIQALQNFTSAFVVTNGGPMKSTYIIGMKLYDDAFVFNRIGYASAESWVLFLIILFLTLLVFGTSNTWVYYGDEGERK